MSAGDFFDSNILLYIVSADTAKAERAESLVHDGGTISVQVLNEFVHVARRKYGLPYTSIRAILNNFCDACTVRPLDVDTHALGLDIAERYRFGIYDSLIVASALLAGCRTLYTEDLQHGQTIDGLAVRDPFKA
jgi:predicted nucleic acid-binding protein